MRRLSGFLASALIFLVHYAALSQTGPVSLDRFDLKQRLYLLDEGGRILVSDNRQPDKPAKTLVTVPSNLKALDILTTKLWGDRELLFVTAYGLTSGDSRPRLMQYSGAGERQCEWILPEISAGLDVDTGRHVVYLAGNMTGTVYSLALLKDTCYGPRQLNPVLKIAGGGRLGPLVVDSRRRLAFVGDGLRGSIYRIILDRGEHAEIAGSLGQPVALLFDDSTGHLYAADSTGRRIWLIDVNRATIPTPTPRVLSRDPAFQEPACLTFASNGGLVVGDRRAKRIFLMDLAGHITQQVAMPE